MTKSLRQVRRLKITAVKSASGNAPTLVDHYLGSSTKASAIEYLNLKNATGPNVAMQLVDKTANTDSGFFVELPTLWHVLWIRDEASATVEIVSGNRKEAWPIAPGDSCFVPRSATVRASGDQLALAISVASGLPDRGKGGQPTHGIDQMFGHNRKTTSYLVGGVAISRWKLTEPLRLTEHAQGSVIVLVLAGKLAIRTADTIDLLTRGQAALITLESDVVISPDGLGYLLLIETRTEADATEELRANGAKETDIRTIFSGSS